MHIHVFCKDLVKDVEILFVGPRIDGKSNNKTVDKLIGTQISQVKQQAFQVTGKERQSEDPVSDMEIP